MSLVPGMLEKEIARLNGGLNLGSQESVDGMSREDEEHYGRLIPFFSEGVYPMRALHELVQTSPAIDVPHAMLVNDVAELEGHMLKAYQVAYAHYALAKKDGDLDGFPYSFCGLSAGNVVLSLFAHGYTNAAFAESKTGGHCYPVLPFVMGDGSGVNGVIGIDPTSDQLWKRITDDELAEFASDGQIPPTSDELWGPIESYEEIPGPRNAVFIAQGDDWVYDATWREGENLFPDFVTGYAALREFVLDRDRWQWSPLAVFKDIRHNGAFEGGEKYLQAAYGNQVRLGEING
ncbi:MAG: hypothetical protein QF824_03970 [Candidatus Woesearchaeota archaeon]|jgi:hypothetical protein|nr:hypothetical protein [Candidatus Woesearchaeota archaeon]